MSIIQVTREQLVQRIANKEDISANAIDVSQITNMNSLFRSVDFNDWSDPSLCDISDWDVSNVTTMNFMFREVSSFNQDINGWDVSNVTAMHRMFHGALSFNQNIGGWDVSNVTNMSYMFNGASSFNQDISGWDVSNVAHMVYMFWGASSFNQDINGWDISGAKTLAGLFMGASSFNQDISGWDVSHVTGMENMFNGASSFNQDISGWDVSNVATMATMFNEASSFNQDISGWDVRTVHNYIGFSTGSLLSETQIPYFTMDGIIRLKVQTQNENQTISIPLNNSEVRVFWGDDSIHINHVGDELVHTYTDVGIYDILIYIKELDHYGNDSGNYSGIDSIIEAEIDVTGTNSILSSLQSAFRGCVNLEKVKFINPLKNITNISHIFDGASSFNSDISSLMTSNIINMEYAFNNASSFNQDLRYWDVRHIESEPTNFSTGASSWDEGLQPLWGQIPKFREIEYIQDIVNLSDRPGHYIFTRDLDFLDDNSYDQTDPNWESLKTEFTTGEGWKTLNFSGVINGDGFYIHNLYINNPGGSNVGFIRLIKNGVNIEKLHFKNVYINGYSDISLFVLNPGINDTIIRNCYVSGGEIIGLERVGTFINSLPSSLNTKIINCKSAIKLTNPSTASDYIGGIVGRGYNITIDRCISECEISGGSGIIGGGSSNLIKDSYFIGTLNSYDGITQGGIIARPEDGGVTIESCYVSSDISGNNIGIISGALGGGINPSSVFYDSDRVDESIPVVNGVSGPIEGISGKSTSEMKDIQTFIGGGWDIAEKDNHDGEIWVIEDGEDTPRLAWEEDSPIISDKLIGYYGGTVFSPDNAVSATLQVGSVREPTLISIFGTETDIPVKYNKRGLLYTFGPDQKVFQNDVTVTFDLDALGVPELERANVAVYWSKKGRPNDYELKQSTLDANILSIQVDHFSNGFIGDPVQHTVTYVTPYGQELVDPVSIDEGHYLERPDEYVKDSGTGLWTTQINSSVIEPSKVLSFWYLDAEFTQPWNFETDAVFDDITLYARWVEDDTVTTYTFLGWYTDEMVHSVNNLWDFNTDIVEDDLTLYAGWFESPSIVMFNSNGGSLLVETISVPVGETVPRPVDPSRDGFEFFNWFRDEMLTEVHRFTGEADAHIKEDDIVLHAKWLTGVTFVTNAYGGIYEGPGPVVETQYIEEGGFVTEEIPVFEGYTFVGWFKDEAYTDQWNFATDTVGDEPFTLYGRLEIDVLTVTFVTNGGTLMDTIDVHHHENISEPALDATTREGYSFVRWYLDEALTIPINFEEYVMEDNVTLYAEWEIKVYTITFDSKGGSPVPKQNIEHGQKIIEPVEPVKVRFAFYDEE